MPLDLNKVIEQVSKDKGIDKKILIGALESAMLAVAQKKYGEELDMEAQYNEEAGEIELFQFKRVVETVENEGKEITLPEAKKLDPDAQIDDSLGLKIDSEEFGRIAAQTAKQVIIQKIRDAEREIYYGEYIGRKGELITGIIRRFEKRNILVDLGRTEAILYDNDQIPGERFRIGDRIQAYIKDVQKESKGPQIILSRACNEFLVKLFEIEVPEIHEGIVQVHGAAREPGDRAKVAVSSSDNDVDPVGACVGVKGSRVKNIVQELHGEKIDIVVWDPDPAKFVCNALSPAEILRVLIDENQRSMELTVPDDHLSLAIGKKGQNVRLAAQLTKWNIDILSENESKEKALKAKELFMALPNVDEALADLLIKNGFMSLASIANTTPKNLTELFAIKSDLATGLIEAAKQKSEEGVTGTNEENLAEKKQEEKQE